MEKIKSHFRFSKKQRNEILFLIALIIIVQLIYFNLDFSKEAVFQTDSKEVLAIQKKIDSLREIKSNPKTYPIRNFNPNFISEYFGYTLGLSPEEIDRLHKFREEDKWINSVADFKKVTQVSDSVLNIISPYFQFPEWVTNPKPKSNYNYSREEKSFDQKIDLNKADTAQLKKIYGVGEVLSKRIIDYRARLNGFLADEQLYDIYGLENAVVKRIMEEFTVKEKPKINKININKASASDIATLPFINFQLAKEIIDYRYLHEGIKELEELKNIEAFPAHKFERFALYLTVQ